MRLLYIQDHRYNSQAGKIYSTGTMSEKVFSRFRSFNHIQVVARIENVPNDLTFKTEAITCGKIDFYSFSKFDLLKLSYELKRKIEQSDYVVLRVPGVFSLSIASYLIKNSIPYGLEVVGCPFDSYWNYGGVLAKVVAVIEKQRMKRVCKHADKACYVTKGFLQNRYPTNGKTINASNVDVEPIGEDLAEIRLKKIQIDKSAIKIGMIANLEVKYKGHDTLLKSIKILEKKGYQFEIFFVGDGSIGRIENIARELELGSKINFLGKISHHELISGFLPSIDILVNPSRQEGLPRVVIEAMSCCVPVIASSVAGTPELLPYELLHDPNDYEDLSVKVQNLISDNKNLRQLLHKNYLKSYDFKSEVLNNRRIDFWSQS